MKVKILGKHGPFVTYANCATSGYLVEEDEFKMLLDMGSGVLSRLLECTDISKLDGIFVSHLHFDHTSDLLPFKYYMDSMGKPINIYTEYSDSDWYKLLFSHPRFNVINVDENTELEIKGKKIKFFRMTHPVPTLAIRIEGNKNFAYTGDTVYNNNLIPLLTGCDIAVCDCAKPSTFKGPHMNVNDTKKLLTHTDVKKIIVSHFSPKKEDLSEFNSLNRIIMGEELQEYNA